MSSYWQAFAGFIGVVGTTASAYFVARLGYRSSKHATDATASLTEEANAISGFHQLVEDLQKDMTRLRDDHDRLRLEHADLKSHVTVLESERAKDKSVIRHLITYVQTLVQVLQKARLPVPPPPGGLDFEDGPFRR